MLAENKSLSFWLAGCGRYFTVLPAKKVQYNTLRIPFGTHAVASARVLML